VVVAIYSGGAIDFTGWRAGRNAEDSNPITADPDDDLLVGAEWSPYPPFRTSTSMV
jgi:hypothetical protein